MLTLILVIVLAPMLIVAMLRMPALLVATLGVTIICLMRRM